MENNHNNNNQCMYTAKKGSQWHSTPHGSTFDNDARNYVPAETFKRDLQTHTQER